MIEKDGNRYLFVPAFPPGALLDAFVDYNKDNPDHCVECGAEVRHASEPYFQRNEINPAPLPVAPDMAEIAAMIVDLTYDCVCYGCGRKELGELCPTR